MLAITGFGNPVLEKPRLKMSPIIIIITIITVITIIYSGLNRLSNKVQQK